MAERQTANGEIKKINRSNIYHLIRQNHDLSRQDIVVQLRLSLPTVTQNLTEMMEDGLIFESGIMGNTGGRSAKVYSVVKNARTAIGLDISRKYVSAVAVDLFGTIICQKKLDLRFERSAAYFETLGKLVEDVVTLGNLDRDKVIGVGIGMPGLISGDGQYVYYCKVLELTDATSAEIAPYISFPTRLIHDASASGFAEIWTNGDMRNTFYIMLNHSVGGALIIDGLVYAGENCRSAEIGHVRIVPHGRKCYCGGEGCMDPYCSSGNLSEIASGSLKTFFEMLQEGNIQARAVWSEYLFHLASAIINVRMLIDCPIILGGHVGEYMDPFIDELRALVSTMDPFEDTCDYICACKYKNEAVAVGAALTFVDAFVGSI